MGWGGGGVRVKFELVGGRKGGSEWFGKGFEGWVMGRRGEFIWVRGVVAGD